MLVDKIKWALKEAFRAGVRLCPTGTSLDDLSMNLEVYKVFLEIENDLVAQAKRVVSLSSVIEDLLEQHRRQDDMGDCGRRCSYPDKFPEWDHAWDNAAKVLFEGGD